MKQRIDWASLLGDIAYRLGNADALNPDVRIACSQERLAQALLVPRGTLRNWVDGSEPRHADGEALLERWSALCGKAMVFAPLVRSPLSAGRVTLRITRQVVDLTAGE